MDVSLEELPAVAGVIVMALPLALLCAAFARTYVRGQLSLEPVQNCLVRPLVVPLDVSQRFVDNAQSLADFPRARVV